MIAVQPYTRYSQRPPKPKFLTTLGEAIVGLFFAAGALAFITALFLWLSPLGIEQ